ncbi:MAG TPA: aminoglycoside phosphotransferase family protein [Haliangiales bacterium]|nr:aminoglycoside phosphotransferase family protein [Haliangiales bacterium]
MPIPPRDALDWVAREVGGGARVVGVRRMKGGIASAVHRVRLELSSGPRDVVLRRWLHDDWGDPAASVHREMATLEALRAVDLGVAVPTLLAASPTGAGAGGRPALLMDRIAGRVHLSPRDPQPWLRQMARTAVRIHHAAVEAIPYESWLEPEKLERPADATRPDLWDAAHAIIRGDPPPYAPRFLHRDYQHFNLLWVRERLTGVLDWGSACVGPADIDLGHCRLNLAVLFTADWAERFRAMYEAEAGRAIDPWWDLQELLVYGDSWPRFLHVAVAGRRPVDTAGMTGRVESLLEAVLRRF